MPHFDENGFDTVICQVCARIVSTGKEEVFWRCDITGSASAGNVCEGCVAAYEAEASADEICMGCGTRCGTNGRCQE